MHSLLLGIGAAAPGPLGCAALLGLAGSRHATPMTARPTPKHFALHTGIAMDLTL